ncbi:hypothetical protein [Corynebacterium pseudotuberculosis]|uniref:hypothetical protein n=1 Tax=Corynebacterium pseudotuberculosis TaxID=1719 RepID=UPI00090ACBC7|nr:hypothetical protein [Corynebacterium pseudotuberculosis]AFM08354.2 hypothetical protein CP162_10655 [Corynebacterium pseudotuberculosis Cp162]APG82759.1 Hypothetical protein CPI37_2153 [Corynebacterium pseudotuberculosis]WFP67163.1 hypothetical protein P8128_10570 [Corynebacterium pseudotuberculosis]
MRKLTAIAPAALALGIAFGIPATAMAADASDDAPTTTIATREEQVKGQIGNTTPDFKREVGPEGNSYIHSYGYKFYGTQKSADAINAWINGAPFSPTGETDLGTQTLTLPSGRVVQPGEIVVLDVDGQSFSVVRNATVK